MTSTLLLVERQAKILSLLYQGNRLIQANAYHQDGSDMECIYIGKIKNIVPSIEAAFVEYKPDTIGFLSLKNLKNPIVTNRQFEGKLIAGDEIVVQVDKEGIKTKSPGLTCNLSFTGTYCVLTTGKQNIGFSSKFSESTKQELKQHLKEHNVYARLKAEEVGMVVRTNAGSLSDFSLFLEELETLLEKKNTLLKQAPYRTCFSLLSKPAAPYITEIRDLYSFTYDKIVTDNEMIYQEIKKEFPLLENIVLYQDNQISLSKLYSVETRLKEALAEKVWLKSGAYLIIQPTEALTVIDVNSGKLQKKHPGDDIFLQINKEAAKEIALQLRLRNLSGIIVVDFINQVSKEQDTELLQYFSNLVKKDPIQTDVIDMTPLGLVEVTRKKIHKSLKEQLLQSMDL